MRSTILGFLLRKLSKDVDRNPSRSHIIPVQFPLRTRFLSAILSCSSVFLFIVIAVAHEMDISRSSLIYICRYTTLFILPCRRDRFGCSKNCPFNEKQEKRIPIILGVVKRNPLFLHEIEWKNNGFLFTTPNIYFRILITSMKIR